MAFKYLVVGPDKNPTDCMKEVSDEGHTPVLIEDGTTLRGRAFGEILTFGDVERKWNWQDIWESIQNFQEIYQDHKETEEDGRSEDFFEYGI